VLRFAVALQPIAKGAAIDRNAASVTSEPWWE
jgi:hypothetical protein